VFVNVCVCAYVCVFVHGVVGVWLHTQCLVVQGVGACV